MNKTALQQNPYTLAGTHQGAERSPPPDAGSCRSRASTEPDTSTERTGAISVHQGDSVEAVHVHQGGQRAHRAGGQVKRHHRSPKPTVIAIT